MLLTVHGGIYFIAKLISKILKQYNVTLFHKILTLSCSLSITLTYKYVNFIIACETDSIFKQN